MILYFSGGTTSKEITKFMQDNNCARLFSYWNDKKAVESKVCENVFLDCGAWTAFTKNIKIDLDVYMKYLQDHKDCYTVAASLDVIPQNNFNASAQESWNNFLTMRKTLGKEVNYIPTYHRGEDISNLERILTYQDEYGPLDYIGIGAVASNKNRDVRNDFLDTVFQVISKKNPTIKIHLFGLTDLSLLDKYPIYSADSTTWVMAGAMGEIITDYGRIKISNKNFATDSVAGFSAQEKTIIMNYIEQYGFTLEELQESSEKRQMFNILFMKRKADAIQFNDKHFKPKKRLF